MKNQIFKISVFLILSPWLLICCQDPVSVPIEAKQTNCYFQFEYINHAWGFSHGGFTITPSGKVYTFDKTTPWTFAVNSLLSFAALDSNINASVKRDTLIGSSDLAHYQTLAFIATSGVMSSPVLHGADMGAHLCKIIVPDPGGKPGVYREFILLQTGDTEFHNLTPEAALISDWLLGIRLP